MQFIKYIPFILVGIAAIMAVYYIFTKDHLLKFVVDSMTTDGKPDSKKMSGFILLMSLIVGFLVAIYYADKHLAPEFYVWIIAGLVASFYGIREVSRFITTKYGSPATTTGAEPEVTADQNQQPGSKPVPTSKKVEPDVTDQNPGAPDEIG